MSHNDNSLVFFYPPAFWNGKWKLLNEMCELDLGCVLRSLIFIDFKHIEGKIWCTSYGIFIIEYMGFEFKVKYGVDFKRFALDEFVV